MPEYAHSGKVRFSISLKKDIFSGGNMFYTYLKIPMIEKIFPNCGSKNGNTEIFVHGKNFVNSKRIIKIEIFFFNFTVFNIFLDYF